MAIAACAASRTFTRTSTRTPACIFPGLKMQTRRATLIGSLRGERQRRRRRAAKWTSGASATSVPLRRACVPENERLSRRRKCDEYRATLPAQRPAFVTYMVLLAAVLGFAALVRHMRVIRATVFSRATVDIGFLLWLNALSAAIDAAFRCIGGCEWKRARRR
jgi:hypothetical protein